MSDSAKIAITNALHFQKVIAFTYMLPFFCQNFRTV